MALSTDVGRPFAPDLHAVIRLSLWLGYYRSMRVLIVGYGYVGRALAAELLNQGHEVTGLRRSLPQVETPEPRVPLISADITSPATLPNLQQPFDWVVNCFAPSASTPGQYRSLYLEGTRNLLSWLAPTPPKKLVYTSSTGVYGQVDGSSVTESSETSPGNDTGQILIETEQLLLNSASVIPAVVLRVAGIYGPGRGYWLRQFLAGAARIEEDGTRILNMIHRDDLARIIIAALEHGRPGEIFNVVDNEPISQRDLFAWLAQTLAQPLPPSIPQSADSSRRRALTNKRVSNAKLRRDLGYTFLYPTFREGFTAELQARSTADQAGS